MLKKILNILYIFVLFTWSAIFCFMIFNDIRNLGFLVLINLFPIIISAIFAFFYGIVIKKNGKITGAIVGISIVLYSLVFNMIISNQIQFKEWIKNLSNSILRKENVVVSISYPPKIGDILLSAIMIIAIGAMMGTVGEKIAKIGKNKKAI